MEPNAQNPASQAPATGETAPAAGIPQNQDKTDAMTYPIGSQNAAPADPNQQEDHRSILERIMGIFSKGKKPEQAPQGNASTDQTTTNTTPPPGQ